MIKETYCSFEVAKLLKEKGFNEICSRYYNSQFNEMRTVGDICMMNWNSISDEYISIPTLQMAMKWLREVHNLFIFPFPQRNTDSFWVEIYSIDKDKNENDKWENLYCESIDLKNFSTYEEACELAIKYCLEKIIK